jgi:hypothetical protein
MKGFAVQRSLISRVVLLFFQAFFAIFFYQVRSSLFLSIVG